MKQCFKFKALTNKDIPTILVIEQASQIKPWSVGMFKDSLAANYQCIGCWLNKRLIGYFIVSVYEDECHILNLCIEKTLQGHGMGTLLLIHLHSHIAHLQVKNCFLEVRKSNKVALTLYKKFNYQVIGIRKNYYPTNHGHEDAIVMRKIICRELISSPPNAID